MDIKFNAGDIDAAIANIREKLTALQAQQNIAKNAADTVLSNVGGELNGTLSRIVVDNNTATFNNASAVIDSFIAALEEVKTTYKQIEDDIMAKIDAALGAGSSTTSAF